MTDLERSVAITEGMVVAFGIWRQCSLITDFPLAIERAIRLRMMQERDMLDDAARKQYPPHLTLVKA